jgi:hypothetical protein
MRLITWNANYNNKRRSLEETAALLSPLDPDVLVLSEVGAAVGPGATCIGETPPFLAVVVRDGIDIAPHPRNASAPTFAAAFHLSGRVRFDLLALWPVKRPAAPSYHSVLMSSLEHFADMFRGGAVILAGDLNSSSGVMSQQRTHPVFVAAAASLGLVSAYHDAMGEQHGKESTKTFWQNDRGYHLDYCFLPQKMAPASTVRILDGEEWRSLSDHRPVVLDVLDEAFAP